LNYQRIASDKTGALTFTHIKPVYYRYAPQLSATYRRN